MGIVCFFCRGGTFDFCNVSASYPHVYIPVYRNTVTIITLCKSNGYLNDTSLNSIFSKVITELGVSESDSMLSSVLYIFMWLLSDRSFLLEEFLSAFLGKQVSGDRISQLNVC